MIEINSRIYKLCLFDTNALSSFLQKPKEWLKYFNNEFSLSENIICYSIFTLCELYYRKELFEKYLDIFSVIPSAILDGYESIFKKEIKSYTSGERINPIIVAPFAIKEDRLTPKERLLKLIQESEFINKTDYWKKGQEDVLNGIIKLKKNYPPKNTTYTIKEIEHFNFVVSTSQIGIRDKQFAWKIINSGNAINLDKFPSIRCVIYFVFYKFYPDKRKPINSDVFDIIISSLLPYVDSFITEGNMFEIISRIKKNHNFLNNIKSYKMKDINNIIEDYTKQ